MICFSACVERISPLKGNIGAKPNSVNTKLSQKYLPRWLYFTKICPPQEIKKFKKEIRPSSSQLGCSLLVVRMYFFVVRMSFFVDGMYFFVVRMQFARSQDVNLNTRILRQPGTSQLREGSSQLRKRTSLLRKSTSHLREKVISTTSKVHPCYDLGGQKMQFFHLRGLISFT